MFALARPTHLVLRKQESRFSCSSAALNKKQKSRQGRARSCPAGWPCRGRQTCLVLVCEETKELGRQRDMQQANSVWLSLYLWCLMRDIINVCFVI